MQGCINDEPIDSGKDDIHRTHLEHIEYIPHKYEVEGKVDSINDLVSIQFEVEIVYYGPKETNLEKL